MSTPTNSSPASSEPREYRWKDLLSQLLAAQDLSVEQSQWAMDTVMRGERSPVEIAGFLVALRAKGEQASELDGLSRAMLDNALPLPVSGLALDIVGTGGDGLDTVNISTMSSLTAAGAGIKVVKHGNRGSSTSSGAADVIEELGVNLSLSPELVAESAEAVGITFAFAQVFHPSMRFAAQARRELGIPTAFNVLGPLANPAKVRANCIGAASARVAPMLAEVLSRRDIHGFVVRGSDGRDKITTSGPSQVWEFSPGLVTQHMIDPEEFGVQIVEPRALAGGSPSHNAHVVREYLAGVKGPVRDAVLLNAAAGIAAAHWSETEQGDRLSLNERINWGLEQARESVDSGAAAQVLENWVAFSRSAGPA